jgi:hypothetical protein
MGIGQKIGEGSSEEKIEETPDLSRIIGYCDPADSEEKSRGKTGVDA